MAKTLTATSIAVAGYNVYKAFYTSPKSQSREKLIGLLDKELVAYENGDSRSAAAGLFFLEILTSGIPLRRIFKASPPVKKTPTLRPAAKIDKTPLSARATETDARMTGSAGHDPSGFKTPVEPVDLTVTSPQKTAGAKTASSARTSEAVDKASLPKKAEEPHRATATERSLDGKGLDDTLEAKGSRPKAPEKSTEPPPQKASADSGAELKTAEKTVDPDIDETNAIRGTNAESKMNREHVSEKDGLADPD
ncbi:MAG: hypothetical protein MJA29_11790, partial [Candidatus Omnitrophica bacterium]|nr:hypothetical protein [Candidatus Omnitrophota bacterium]